MITRRASLSAVITLGFLVAATPIVAAEAPRVRVTTTLGAFVIELNPERAPLTVENFLQYVRDGHYTGTLFHRVIANFVIQGGGLTTAYTQKPVRAPIANESGNGLQNLRGAVGLARSASPHSGDGQFYVNIANNADLDPLPTRWGYAVFGRVVEGMDVVDRISLQPAGAVGGLKSDAPLKQVVIESVELIDPASAAPPP
jgi:cyclophilin family peptidyl-prolyl cis-trans isomerase